MTSSDNGQLDLRSLLAAVEASAPVDAVDVLALELARAIDAQAVSLLIGNFSGNAVIRMAHVAPGDTARSQAGRNERTTSLPMPGSPYQEALMSQELQLVREGDGWIVLLPVTERGDAIGLLELSLRYRPGRETLDYLTSAAHALAYVLIASRRHTDLFEWAQRDTPFTLAAELQRRLLPSSYTVEGGPFTLAGWLEPAATVGGDTFDYSIDRDHLHVSITDAMGHSTQAALLATLAVGSLRNTRRMVASVEDQANRANAALLEDAGDDQFVTGLLVRLRLADGLAELVNAGHLPPYLVRDDRVLVLELLPGLPLGVAEGRYLAETVQLQIGDRLLLLTDGFVERNAAVDIADILRRTRSRHPREVVRELARNVLSVTGGNLRDDATVVCLDWYGPSGDRHASAGASQVRATSP